MSQGGNANPRYALGASLMHHEYGRSMRLSIMTMDALYALAEVFSFVPASEIAFLNLIEHKLNKYAESGEQEFDILSNPKYVMTILCRNIQKIDQILEAISSINNKKWPKADKQERAKTVSGDRSLALQRSHHNTH